MVDHEIPADQRPELLAGELHECARTLSHLTQGPPGLTRPEAACTILGNLAQTAFRLVQTAEQLDAFLTRELDAGRLAHERGGDPVPAVLQAHDALSKASEQSMDLGEFFLRAQGAVAAVHPTEGDLEPLPKAEAGKQTRADKRFETTSAEVQSPPKDFPHPIGDVLSDDQTSPPAAERRASPNPPPPRREL